ncbi:minor tail protein [Mycobacterium phage Weirdo19]|uniref:Minor tail protein n=1 Tax=Mycobacterium phage Weirdo19 TaxID=2601610 RepID=A0A6M2YST2_9CAUD|nr:minor tail protein [Mycobacterium phage Weirdo19]QEA10787.1 minor tail protein [Mycobacterium phage Weirdo19]
MSKAARLRRKKTRGNRVFPNFPYEREFTQAELDALFARWERIKETLRDAVGPQGWGMGLPEDLLQQLALHQALAGVDADAGYPPFDEATGTGAFIRPVRNPDGLHTDSIKWVLTKHDKAGDRRRDAQAEARARIKALQENAMRGVSDDVREAMVEMFAAGTEWAEDQKTVATDPEPWAEKLDQERKP